MFIIRYLSGYVDIIDVVITYNNANCSPSIAAYSVWLLDKSALKFATIIPPSVLGAFLMLSRILLNPSSFSFICHDIFYFSGGKRQRDVGLLQGISHCHRRNLAQNPI